MITKNKGGRPSKFGSVDQRQLEMIYRDGWTDAQVAEFVGVTRTTIENWKVKYPKFFTTLKDWKLNADKEVELSLYKRANGFEYEEVRTENVVVGENKLPGEKKTITRKLYVGDVTAQIFWLKNRQPAEWRDKEVVIDNSTKNYVQIYRPEPYSREKVEEKTRDFV